MMQVHFLYAKLPVKPYVDVGHFIKTPDTELEYKVICSAGFQGSR